MKPARIRQLEKLVRGLQADGYKVNVLIKAAQRRLIININLHGEDAKEIMAQWNDLRKIEGG